MIEIKNPEISIVIPFFNEEEMIPLLRERFANLKELPNGWELIFVSDGTTDKSVQLVENWAAEDNRIKLVVLTRNFGHQAAISAGLDHVAGDFAGIMDADLQDPPEVLLKMYQEARKGGWDIVYGVRSHRHESWTKRTAYKAFYLLYSFLADTPVALDSGDFCVLNRRTVRVLSSMPERLRFVRGLRSWLGLRQIGYPIDRPKRAAGNSQYSFRKLVSLALTGITSFSIKPLRLATFFGLFLCVLSLGAALVYLILFFSLNLHKSVPGFTTLVILVLLMSGLQFLMVGILGEYIGRIYWEVKQRPTYLIDRTVNCKEKFNTQHD